MIYSRQIKKLIRKNSQRIIKKFFKRNSEILLKKSFFNNLDLKKEDPYVMYENHSELIIKINLKFRKDQALGNKKSDEILGLLTFIDQVPEKIMKFMQIENNDENESKIGFR